MTGSLSRDTVRRVIRWKLGEGVIPVVERVIDLIHDKKRKIVTIQNSPFCTDDTAFGSQILQNHTPPSKGHVYNGSLSY